MPYAANSVLPIESATRHPAARLALTLKAGVLLAAVLFPMACHAWPKEGAAADVPSAPAGPLNLRLPSQAASASAAEPARTGQHRQERPHQTLHLQPRKSVIEWGVEGSREALIACQNGAYPGATVAAYGVQTSSGDAQPGHCYRF